MRAVGMVATRGPKAGQPAVARLAQATGLAWQTCYDLVRTPWRVKRLDFATVERVCEALACTPGDLLAFDPKAPARVPLRPRVNPLASGAERGLLGRLRDP